MLLTSFIAIFLLQLNIVLVKSKNIELTALGISYSDDSEFYTRLFEKFNEYKKKKNLEINVDLNVISQNNSTASPIAFKAQLSSQHKKRKKNYDLIFYDIQDLKDMDQYLIDLNKYLEKDHINMHDPDILSVSCIRNNKLIGLPITVSYSVLYSNRNLLKKYNKRIPKTWEELMNTGKEIFEMEKKLNDTIPNLTIYNGPFNSYHTSSFYEFIYSYRNSTNSPYPPIISHETREAFNMIKRIKNNISSDEEFDNDDMYTLMKLVDGSSIFLNYWILAYPFAETISKFYDMSILPGSRENFSAATVNGFNIGINNLLEDERTDDSIKTGISNQEKIEAAIEVIKFATSKDLQKQFFIEGYSVPGIPSLFNDNEICEIKDCEMFKSMQPIITRPNDLFGGNFSKFEYDDKYRKYALKYIFDENGDLEKTLKNIEDITKIYYIPYNKTESPIGFITIIIVSVISILMLLSLIFLFFENFQPFFKFLSIDSWILLIFGTIMILGTIITFIGEVTKMKCHLRILLFGVGMTLYLINILYELISSIPEDFNICIWIKNHKYLFILFFLSIDFLLNGLITLQPYQYDIKSIIIEEGQNFQICKMYNKFGKSLIILMVILKVMILFAILFFIFLEWNLKKIFYDIRFMILAIYSNLMLIFMYFLIETSHINNYLLQYILQTSIVFFFSLSSYIFLYGYKLFFAVLNKKNVKLLYINNINENFIHEGEYSKSKSKFKEQEESNIVATRQYDTGDTNSNADSNYSNANSSTSKKRFSTRANSIFSKILNIHYSTEGIVIKEEDDIIVTRDI